MGRPLFAMHLSNWKCCQSFPFLCTGASATVTLLRHCWRRQQQEDDCGNPHFRTGGHNITSFHDPSLNGLLRRRCHQPLGARPLRTARSSESSFARLHARSSLRQPLFSDRIRMLMRSRFIFQSHLPLFTILLGTALANAFAAGQEGAISSLQSDEAAGNRYLVGTGQIFLRVPHRAPRGGAGLSAIGQRMAGRGHALSDGAATHTQGDAKGCEQLVDGAHVSPPSFRSREARPVCGHSSRGRCSCRRHSCAGCS